MRREIVGMRRTLVLLVSLGLVIALTIGIPVLAASIYESYITGDDAQGSIYGNRWRVQTFTPSAAHTVTSVKLMLFRENSPGTVTVGIRDTSGGQPTGPDLCSGTTDGDTLPTGSPYEWREITFTSSYALSAGIQYAIVVRAPGGDVSNRAWWRVDASSPTYGGGNSLYSNDGGTNWIVLTSDSMFEEWGDPLGAVGWETYSINKVHILLPWIALVAAVAAGITILARRRRAQS
jgi:hypothetical protein